MFWNFFILACNQTHKIVNPGKLFISDILKIPKNVRPKPNQKQNIDNL
jgi:hypothetical protein